MKGEGREGKGGGETGERGIEKKIRKGGRDEGEENCHYLP